MSPKRLSLILWFLFIASCGSAGSTSDPGNSGGAEITPSEAGTPVTLTYFFETQLDSDDDLFDFALPYPDSYSVPFYIQNTGVVTLMARDFPRMVLRICEATASGCDVVFEDLGTDKIDLVLDSCGKDKTDDECGSADDTAYTGTLSSDGSLTIYAVAIRARLFLVTEDSDGFTADPTDTGLIPNLDRLMGKAATDTTTSGDLTATGSRVNDSAVKLVAGGTVPDSIPTLGGVHYISSLTGTFDVDPLGLLE